MQVREHHKSFYQQYFKAKLLADSKGYDSVPGCTNLKWELKDTPGDFFKLIGDNTCLFANHYDKIKHLQVENHE